MYSDMQEDKITMRDTTKRIVTTTLGLTLATMSLVACTGQEEASDANATDNAIVSDEPRKITGSTDVKDWKTVADAYAGTEETLSTSYDDTYYIGVYEGDGKTARIVVKMTPEAFDKLSKVDYSKSRNESDKQVIDAIGKLPLEVAEDLTADELADDVLQGLHGKTGRELIDDGFVFEGYSMTGNDETGALLAKGSFSYLFMFDCATPAEMPADDGESIMAGHVTSATRVGISGAASDPTLILSKVASGKPVAGDATDMGDATEIVA